MTSKTNLQKIACVSRCSYGEYAELYILLRTICRGMDSCFNERSSYKLDQAAAKTP